MVLVLQKLVHTENSEMPLQDGTRGDGGDGDDRWTRKDNGSRRSLLQKFTDMFRARGSYEVTGPPSLVPPTVLEGGQKTHLEPSSSVDSNLSAINRFRTLQRYHASHDDARADFMEGHSALSKRNLAVAVEQVSVFITNDNTVISFFELSAQDIQDPILQRLTSSDTVLRRSCDASLVAQAILDAIVDLAIPLTVCYGDVIADLELDVLTRPSVNHTKSLYITITEVNKVLSFINPVMNLINTLRDHKADMAGPEDMRDPKRGVVISPYV